MAINFVVVEGKLKFEINTANLKRAGCRQALQLLKLAMIPVPESVPGGGLQPQLIVGNPLPDHPQPGHEILFALRYQIGL